MIKMDDNKPTTKGNNSKKINLPIIIVIAVIVIALVTAFVFIFFNMKKSDVGVSSTPTSSIASSDVNATLPEIEEDEFDPETGILLEFVDRYREAPEFIGRLTIPNTLLDIEVAQGNDNAYYLDHTLDGNVDPYGTPFLDYRASIEKGSQSDVLTIYGHNSKNGDYFESVKEYKNIDYYKKNPILEFRTIHGTAKYKILGVFTEYVEGTTFFAYHDQIYLNEEYYNKYVTEVDKRNYYENGIDLKFGDQFIALSTCNDEIQGPLNTPYRDVLVARRVRDGESVEVDVEQIKPNEDVVMPDGWKEKFKKENPYK